MFLIRLCLFLFPIISFAENSYYSNSYYNNQHYYQLQKGHPVFGTNDRVQDGWKPNPFNRRSDESHSQFYQHYNSCSGNTTKYSYVNCMIQHGHNIVN
jgi:hypothetical protein